MNQSASSVSLALAKQFELGSIQNAAWKIAEKSSPFNSFGGIRVAWICWFTRRTKTRYCSGKKYIRTRSNVRYITTPCSWGSDHFEVQRKTSFWRHPGERFERFTRKKGYFRRFGRCWGARETEKTGYRCGSFQTSQGEIFIFLVQSYNCVIKIEACTRFDCWNLIFPA